MIDNDTSQDYCQSKQYGYPDSRNRHNDRSMKRVVLSLCWFQVESLLDRAIPGGQVGGVQQKGEWFAWLLKGKKSPNQKWKFSWCPNFPRGRVKPVVIKFCHKIPSISKKIFISFPNSLNIIEDENRTHSVIWFVCEIELLLLIFQLQGLHHKHFLRWFSPVPFCPRSSKTLMRILTLAQH